MKILLNVTPRMLADLADWNECEALSLRERKDGSFDLYATTDLASARAADEADARLRECVAKATADPSAQKEGPHA